ncbi:uncharacterized protein EAF02_008013 [Botrytis sinoallii]|uniref:uncharacterized protein n=1 Tax=Botrytis sinoallii TaxID=1463999 RepID=UPI0019024380|nr:uncharacterized protein EAF02_008013 [Botrytis sinoallii]KAF7879843.1 hypothetical protein EAF02_008013 [Botrytis sinoallii]
MNQAARALNEISQSLNFNKRLPPLDAYEGLDTPPQLEYADQTSWITNHANNYAPSAIVLSQAKLRHPNVGEVYIKWRSQDMLVKRLWEDVKFPGVDPDPVYTQIRRKYCAAVKKLINEKAEKRKRMTLLLYTKFEVSTESFTDRVRAIKAKKAKEAQEAKDAEKRIQEIEAEEEREEMMEQGEDEDFVVVEMEDADDEDFEWEGDDWDMS